MSDERESSNDQLNDQLNDKCNAESADKFTDTIVADQPDQPDQPDPVGDAAVFGSVAGPGPLVKPLLRGWSHLLAFATLAVLGTVIIRDAAGTDRGPWLIVVYVAGTGAMFGVSAAYHRLRWNPQARALMSKLDHCTIFLAIAGAYTPMAVVTLSGWHRTSVLVTVWAGSVVGIALQWVPFRLPRWAFAAVYVVVGWAALPSIDQWYTGLGPLGFALVMAGGLAYTVGALVYALQRPDPWPNVFGYHEVFHACTIVGAGLHYAAMSIVVVDKF